MFYVETQKVENTSQKWMNDVGKFLNDELKCNAQHTSAWDTASIRTNFNYEKELDLTIQYNNTKDSNIFLAIIMHYMPKNDFIDLAQNFHYCMKIDMSKTSPKEFVDYVVKLYKDNVNLMKRHLNGIIG